jgi:hypothetical protein
MATLNVQPKNKSLWWLWLIIILFVIAIVYFAIHKDDHKTSDKIVTDSTVTTP